MASLSTLAHARQEESAIGAYRDLLLQRQKEDGTWSGLDSFMTLEALMAEGSEKALQAVRKAIPSLLASQRRDGTFGALARQERALIGLEALLGRPLGSPSDLTRARTTTLRRPRGSAYDCDLRATGAPATTRVAPPRFLEAPRVASRPANRLIAATLGSEPYGGHVPVPYDPQRHHRRSYRLPGYDYRKPGPYLITLCTQHRRFFLGSILEGEMRRSPAGLMVDTAWRALPNRFPMLTLDAFVVMPDHFHAIVWLRGGTESGEADRVTRSGDRRFQVAHHRRVYQRSGGATMAGLRSTALATRVLGENREERDRPGSAETVYRGESPTGGEGRPRGSPERG